MSDVMGEILLDRARAESRLWFYKPQAYWFGWSTLLPFAIGHDEFSRRTLLLGWCVTGRIVVALWDCGDEECRRWSIYEIRESYR